DQRAVHTDVQGRHPRARVGQGRGRVRAHVAHPDRDDRAAHALHQPPRGDGVTLQHVALRTFGWLLLAFVLLVALFPPYFMTITAFHPPSLSFSRTPTLFSTDLTLRAFFELFEKYPYATWM